MPVRGLANTLPLHWDGTLGDPVGGPNGAVGAGGSGGSDCTLGDADGAHDCFRDLVNESLSGVMCDQSGGCANGPSGLPGRLDETDRDNMAFFLESVSYPPARSRPLDDDLSASAEDGFGDFFMNQGGNGPNTCADGGAGCHALPLTADTNSSTLQGFDVPTMRGMTDRFLQFSLGPNSVDETLRFAAAAALPYDPNDGLEEDVVFGTAFLIFQPVYNVGPLDLLQMFEEASTGMSGAVGRQVTLDTGSIAQPDTVALLDSLELAADRGLVSLIGKGMSSGVEVIVRYDSDAGLYRVGQGAVDRAGFDGLVGSGDLRTTLTAKLPRNYGQELYPQPLIAPQAGFGSTGNPDLDFTTPMRLVGIDVRQDSLVYVDGDPVSASVACVGGVFEPFCTSQLIDVSYASPGAGMHLLQLQSPHGPLSNEMPVCVGPAGGCL